MQQKYWKEQSRLNWYSTVQDGESLDSENVRTGALLRIADAVELTAKRHAELVAENERLSNSLKFWRNSSEGRDKTISNQKGQITKLRRALAAAKATPRIQE
jgi:hypothetical protein